MAYPLLEVLGPLDPVLAYGSTQAFISALRPHLYTPTGSVHPRLLALVSSMYALLRDPEPLIYASLLVRYATISLLLAPTTPST